MSALPYLRWQNARAPVASSDTPLTNYHSDDLDAAAKKKMIAVKPASAVMLRAFGTDADDEAADVIVSGWMHPFTQTGANFGHRLVRMLVTLGSKGVAKAPSDLQDGAKGKWASSGTTYFEADTYDPATAGTDYDMTGITRLDTSLTDGISNQEAGVIIPTLAYTHLLIEVVLGTAASMGLIWRPVGKDGVIITL